MEVVVDDNAPVEMSGNRTLENSGDNHSCAPPKFKRRKISAIRDFPKDCGRFSPRINEIQSDLAVGNPASAESASSPDQHTELLNLSETLQANITSSVNNVNQMKLLDSTMLSDLPEITQGLESGQNDIPSSSVLQSSSNNVQLNTLESPRTLDQPQPSIPGVQAMEERLPEKYPPPRRISAFRDFPPGCGRNAPRINKDELLKSINSSKNTSLGKQKSSEEHRPLKETLTNNATQKRTQFQVGDALNSKLKGNITKEVVEKVRYKSEMDSIKRSAQQVQVRKDSGNKPKQIDKKEISMRPPSKSNLFQSDSKTHLVAKKIEREAQGKVRKEYPSTQNNDKGFKRKLSEFENKSPAINNSQNEEVEDYHDRPIVQALMAAPLCPWRQGKKGLPLLTTASARRK